MGISIFQSAYEDYGYNMSFQYDCNGNMTQKLSTGDTINLTWNYDNKPASITRNNNQYIFAYDGNGNRVMKQGPFTITRYFGELYEEKGVDTGIFHIFANNQRVVSIRTDGYEQTYHGNHLGSASVITNSTGDIKQKVEYYPFGTYRYGTPSTTGTYDYDPTFQNVNYTFTDQEDDDETGFYNFKARLYDPLIGRFISPDSIVQAPENPQALNRYSYCLNNPLIYTDPSGHETMQTDMNFYDFASTGLSGSINLPNDFSVVSFANGNYWGLSNQSMGSNNFVVGSTTTSFSGGNSNSLFDSIDSGTFPTTASSKPLDFLNGSTVSPLGISGTLVFGWKDRGFGVSGSFSIGITADGYMKAQFQGTHFNEVYGAYIGIGEQYGLSRTKDFTQPLLSHSDPQTAYAGGYALLLAGNEVQISRGHRDFSWSSSGRQTVGLGAYGAKGTTYSINLAVDFKNWITGLVERAVDLKK